MTTRTIRAAVLREMGREQPYARSRPLELSDVELEGPGSGELLVRVRAAGLCHSDLSVIDGSRPRPLPMVLGHEAAGEVIEVGPGAEGFERGDHVVMTFVPSCGGCGQCCRGRPALCERAAAANTAGTLLSGGRRLRDGDGQPLNHHLGVSSFADHAVVSARSAVRVDADLPFDVAALFGCAVLTGAGAVTNSAQVEPGDSVAIFGLGGIGLAALLGAALAGAGTVVAVDVVPEKLELARELGATDALLAEPDVADAVRASTGGGADKAIETVGNVQVLRHAYASTRPGGTTVTVGLPHPEAQLEIQAVSLVAEERTLRGSYLGSCDPRTDIPKLIALHREGRLPVERLVSDRLGLGDLNTGFDALAQGRALRQVVVL